MSDLSYMQSPLERLMQKADVIYAPTDLIMYLGFCQPGTILTSEAKFSICKIEISSSTTPYTQTIKWANGTNAKDLVFDDYAIPTYSFKKF